MLSQRTKKRPSHVRPSQDGRRTGDGTQSAFAQVTGVLGRAPPKPSEVRTSAAGLAQQFGIYDGRERTSRRDPARGVESGGAYVVRWPRGEGVLVVAKLREPKWIGGLLLATLFAVACFHLGQWQWRNYEVKSERNATLDRNYLAEPISFVGATTGEGVAAGAHWTRVEVRGVYQQQQLLVRNRPNDGVYGYEVLGLLDTADAGTVVVNRGWVRNSPDGAAVQPEVIPPPLETVTVIGWVRPFERTLDRDLPFPQVASIARADIEVALGSTVASAYVRVQSENAGDGDVASGLLPLEPPDRSLGSNQAYALQWWATMALGFAFVALGVRREHQVEEDARDPQAAAVRVQARAERKKQKTSRWDEDDY